SSQIQQSPTDRVLANAVGVAKHTVRDTFSDRLPALAVVCCFVGERITIVDLVEIRGYVRGPCIITRWLNVAYRAKGRETENIPGYICPVFSTVASELDEAI